MKNGLLFTAVVCIILMLACNKEESAVSPAPEGQGADIESRTPPVFVALCHLKSDGTFELKNVPQNAVQAHLSHGDFLPDADGDGYTRVGACTGSADDCNDNNSLIHPGATELCNEVDDDCDGLIDAADPGITGLTWFFEDADGDGHGSLSEGLQACWQPEGFVTNISDCDDTNPDVYFGATDIPNDGIDQDCIGGDSVVIVYPPCDCFSMEELQQLYTYTPWPYGWWSDVPGSCKDAPYDQLMELWITNVGQPSQNFNFSAQAGTINGNPFASKARFNHLTGQFDVLCGGYTSAQNASNCAQILHAFIQQLRNTHPTWDYCIRFP